MHLFKLGHLALALALPLSAASVANASVSFGNFEDGLLDGFGTLTGSSGVTKNAFASPDAGAVVVGNGTAAGTDTTNVLDLTASGYNGGLGSGADLGFDFAANGDTAAFLANDLITFQYETAPSSTAMGYSQIYQLVLNAPGPGYQGFGGNSGSTSTYVTATSTNTGFNQSPSYTGQLNTVTINYDAFKAALTSSTPGYIQLGITTNNGGGAPTDFYFDNFTLSTIATPEPASLGLLGLGIGGLITRRRRA